MARVLLLALPLTLASAAGVRADRLALRPIEYGDPVQVIHTYNDIFTAEGRRRAGLARTMLTDPNVWAYTEAFRTRFGMPKQWLEPELEGTFGAAWRHEENAVWQCGFDGDANNCRQESHCRLDVYLTAETEGYWNDATAIAPTLSREQSARFLVPQSEQDRSAREALVKAREHALGDLRISYEGESGRVTTPIVIAEYRREILEHVAYVSLDVPCTVPKDAKPGTGIEIVIDNERVERSHRIHLPASHVARIAAYQAEKAEQVEPVANEGISGDYRTWYTPEGWRARGAAGTYTRDPHIWRYTTEFARRFGMPQEWIHDRLEGAEAVAYRIDWNTQPTCGYFGSADSCYTYYQRKLDVYVDADEPVPWGGYYSANGKFWREHSLRYLQPQDPAEWTRKRTLMYANIREKELGRVQDTRVVRHGIWPITWETFELGGSNKDPESYRMDIFPSLHYLSTLVTFSGLARSDGLQLWFCNELIAPVKECYHTVDIPVEFIRRVQEYNDAFDGEDEFFRALEASLKRRVEQVER